LPLAGNPSNPTNPLASQSLDNLVLHYGFSVSLEEASYFMRTGFFLFMMGNLLNKWWLRSVKGEENDKTYSRD